MGIVCNRYDITMETILAGGDVAEMQDNEGRQREEDVMA